MNEARQIKLLEIEQLTDELAKVHVCPESQAKGHVVKELKKQIDEALIAYYGTLTTPKGKPGL